MKYKINDKEKINLNLEFNKRVEEKFGIVLGDAILAENFLAQKYYQLIEKYNLKNGNNIFLYLTEKNLFSENESLLNRVYGKTYYFSIKLGIVTLYENSLTWKNTAIHEIGHMFGLKHEDKEECYMHFLKRNQKKFCKECAQKLEFFNKRTIRSFINE